MTRETTSHGPTDLLLQYYGLPRLVWRGCGNDRSRSISEPPVYCEKASAGCLGRDQGARPRSWKDVPDKGANWG
ncbi:hypothetical protein CORC01_04652 [Colletotrichum orchidophilum]|uniref:Uncharacterized protein n=1 Tax=Colletotrichum orchidophilum TaxID=1209926 RepID=A0A1G4BF74_9PEZI|nr:uncharacterized protein CORC01_04652 [Colletotrichum orchidophilum]OHF00006.1 hypothetical protein CORC01_04652 [Colletotrichum orchidophilum]